MFDLINDNGSVRITYAGDIGFSPWTGEGLTFAMLREAVEPYREEMKDFTLEICSAGGDVLEAFAMYNYINSLGIPTKAEVTGWAASAASYLIMACDEIAMHANSFLLIHEPSVCECGDRNEHRKAAAVLDDIFKSLVDGYLTHATADRAEIEALVSAETWLTADDAIRLGLADTVLDALPVAADATALKKFSNLPQNIGDEMKRSKRIADAVKATPCEEKVIEASESTTAEAEASESVTAEEETPAEPAPVPVEEPAKEEPAPAPAEEIEASESAAVCEGDELPPEEPVKEADEVAKEIERIEKRIDELEEANEALRKENEALKEAKASAEAKYSKITNGLRTVGRQADDASSNAALADVEAAFADRVQQGFANEAEYVEYMRAYRAAKAAAKR